LAGDIKNAIAIIRKDSSQKKYIIYTKDAQQKKEWLALLQEAVKDLNGNKNTNGSHVKSNNSDSKYIRTDQLKRLLFFENFAAY
jgi:arsenate reductase-like glutaredoxin family protein